MSERAPVDYREFASAHWPDVLVFVDEEWCEGELCAWIRSGDGWDAATCSTERHRDGTTSRGPGGAGTRGRAIKRHPLSRERVADERERVGGVGHPSETGAH